jgi:hypothetical protein
MRESANKYAVDSVSSVVFLVVDGVVVNRGDAALFNGVLGLVFKGLVVEDDASSERD